MSATTITALAERFCQPHRIGLFGHRGVGKTTLLTVLYREAVAGRLPGLRLAAGDAATANYLADKMVQLETGAPLPATLAETELRLHLYAEQTRLELVLRDYQGEHVELGRDGAIQEFLRSCDAVWLGLDLAAVPAAADQLRRQQEVEQLLEDFLKAADRPTLERPMAVVLTKADLLSAPGDDPAALDALADRHCGMTRHALALHCPSNALFAVSAHAPHDHQLAAPLLWLVTALQALDEVRLARIWTLAPGDMRLLERCLRCFTRRYPDAAAARQYAQRLTELKRQRRRRCTAAGLAAAACLTLGVWTYDAIGYQDATAYAAAHDAAPAQVLARWEQFARWHPTRQLSRTVSADEEAQRRAELAQRLHAQQRDERLEELRRRNSDPDADPEAAWQRFQEFRAAHPEVNIEGDLDQLRTAIKARRDEQFNQRADRALDELRRAAERSADLPAVVKQADAFLAEYAGSRGESEGRAYRQAAAHRLDEQDIQTARSYSAKNPLNFQTRREHYQRYLDRHPTGGAFSKEAEDALRTIASDWDKHDFRLVRDQFLRDPGNITAVVALSRRYLAVHPQGKFKAAAAELLRWTERVTAPGEYKVVLRSGTFDSSIGRWFTRGPKLSVELEVNGVRYGPSAIAQNRYDPEWNYEFPRRIRWKLGDTVIIRVKEHSWSDKTMVELLSADNDVLAMRMLTGEVAIFDHRVTFASDFALPTLPKIE